MSAGFMISAQLVTERQAVDGRGLDAFLQSVREAAQICPLEILAVGGEEIPAVFQALAGGRPRVSRQVFVWYPVLADYPGWQPSHCMLNAQGLPTQGLGDECTQESMGERFQFSCPNNPEVRALTLKNVERLLRDYPFDGVFLDKIRFPSPANGLAEMMTCFCPFCREQAAHQGLELERVRPLLNDFPWSRLDLAEEFARVISGVTGSGETSQDALLLGEFLRFRARSITGLVAEIERLAGLLGKTVALDLFSPCLGALVGQDYAALSQHAAWCKPMVYRYAKGPAGLRLEIPRLVEEVARFSGRTGEETWRKLGALLPSLPAADLAGFARNGAPLALIESESGDAVRRFAPKPVYLGIEAVSMAAFDIHVDPGYVRQAIHLAWQAGASGVVLSWDLLSMPHENLRAVCEEVDSFLRG